jgi:hypothetical protein
VFTGSEIYFTEEIRRSGACTFLDALESRLYLAGKLVVVSEIFSGGGPDGGKEGCKEGREEVQEDGEEEDEEEVARTAPGGEIAFPRPRVLRDGSATRK